MPGLVELSDELHLGPAVNRRQLPVEGLAVVSRVGPGEPLLEVVHQVAVVAVGLKERDALARARGWGGRRLLWRHKNMGNSVEAEVLFCRGSPLPARWK